MKITIFTLFMFALFFTGCFGPSDKEVITSAVNKKFELINKSDISLLFNDNHRIEINIQHIPAFIKCLVGSNPKVQDTVIELNNKTLALGDEMSQLDSLLGFSTIKKFDEDFKKAEGNLKEFQALLLSLKNKVSEMDVNPEFLEIMFGGKTLKASTQREYKAGIMLNISMIKILKPLANTYAQEASTCVQDVTGLVPLKNIEEISIIGNEANVTLVFDNNKTSIINLEKVNDKWIFK